MTSIKNKYYRILSPAYPSFLDSYIKCPCLQRLSGISLFCGVDYCGLFHVEEFYSRLDHSIGVALIIWNFTKDKKATIAGLLHDVSTPVFSHVIDFMYKDYLKQEKTEEKNSVMIMADTYLCELLKEDGILIEEVMDYKKYSIADNEVPHLSADRLEYMYSTGMFLTKDFTLESIKRTYNDLYVNEVEMELAFHKDLIAQEFVENCCNVGQFFQTSEDKMSLEYLSRIVKQAIQENVFDENDLYKYTEKEIWDKMYEQVSDRLKTKINNFTNLKKVKHSEEYVDSECTIHMNVKKRYIDPLIQNSRASHSNEECKQSIQSFLNYKDSTYAYIDEECW